MNELKTLKISHRAASVAQVVRGHRQHKLLKLSRNRHKANLQPKNADNLVERFDGRVAALALDLTQRLDTDSPMLGKFWLCESADFSHDMDCLPNGDRAAGHVPVKRLPSFGRKLRGNWFTYPFIHVDLHE